MDEVTFDLVVAFMISFSLALGLAGILGSLFGVWIAVSSFGAVLIVTFFALLWWAEVIV